MLANVLAVFNTKSDFFRSNQTQTCLIITYECSTKTLCGFKNADKKCYCHTVWMSVYSLLVGLFSCILLTSEQADSDEY